MPHYYSQTKTLTGQKTRFFLFFCIATLLLCLSLYQDIASAQAPEASDAPSPISVQSFVAPPTATLGDIVDWTLVVTHDPDIQLLPLEAPKVPGFDLVEQKSSVKNQNSGQIEETIVIQLRADQIGDTLLPDAEIKFKAPRADGSLTEGLIKASSVKVSVQSILRLQGEPEDIRDIKPLIKAPPDWTQRLLYTALALALLYLCYRLWKNRKSSSVPQASETVMSLSPYERVIQELKDLDKKGYLELAKIREYYFELSEVFRRYLGSHYNIPALDWTTEEIIQWAQCFKEWDGDKTERLTSLLQHIDKIKFAKAQVASSRNSIEEVLKFIEATHREPKTVEVSSPSAKLQTDDQ